MIVAFLVACSLMSAFVCAMLVLILLRRNQNMNIFYRLRHHYVAKSESLQKTEATLRRIYKFIQRLAKPLADLELAKKIEFKLRQAGIPLFGAEFIIIALIVAFAAGISVYIITLNLISLPLVTISVLLGLWIWLRMRVDRRRQAFTEQLGDCLTTVSNALRAGYSFQQAMGVVAKEMEPPISTEFERVTGDLAMGVSLEDALEQMNQRIGSPDFDLVVTAVLIQREIGGNLAQILDTISYTINERIRMKREINALTAQGRFSAWILLLLPFAVAAFCWVFNNEQMQLFITEESGHIAIAVSIIMEVIGFIIIQRIVDIEV